MVAPVALIALGVIMLIEMITHISVKAADGPMMKLAGVSFNTHDPVPWAIAIGALAAGAVLARWSGGVVGNGWDQARAVAREKGLTA